MPWYDGLNIESAAFEIAQSAEPRIRVLAGPGAGKSFAMKRRVARLLEDQGVLPEHLLPVTFTRVAAEDLHRELVSLQVNGANLLEGRTLHSLAMTILMSRRPNAPYADRIEEDGTVLIYEGHDVSKTAVTPVPKLLDQPEFLPSGRPTENGKFSAAAAQFKSGKKGPDIVRVYEKLRDGIWSDNGYFHLVDSWREDDANRSVFKFKLIAVESDEGDQVAEAAASDDMHRRRLIPSSVKQEVWKRDRGKCVECGATDELHFDHVVPFSKGGTSLTAENVQLLCARHNLQKSANIQ